MLLSQYIQKRADTVRLRLSVKDEFVGSYKLYHGGTERLSTLKTGTFLTEDKSVAKTWALQRKKERKERKAYIHEISVPINLNPYGIEVFKGLKYHGTFDGGREYVAVKSLKVSKIQVV